MSYVAVREVADVAEKDDKSLAWGDLRTAFESSGSAPVCEGGVCKSSNGTDRVAALLESSPNRDLPDPGLKWAVTAKLLPPSESSGERFLHHVHAAS